MQSLGRMKRFVLLIACIFLMSMPAQAQDVTIPNFWDKNERFAKPDVSKIPRLRFLTTTDFPPFNFIDRERQLAGFHVDLARAICVELELLNRCEIQAIPWEQLSEALSKGQGEAIIAGLAVNSESRKQYNFTRPYLHIPARFVVRKDSELSSPAYDALFRKKTGVVKNSNHSAYFAKVFGTRTAEEFDTRADALKALQEKKVEAVFSDAVSLSFWLSSASSNECCDFLDGPFVSREFFGNGMAIATAKDNQNLIDGMNYALGQINESGRYAEIYLRYFPVGLF